MTETFRELEIWQEANRLALKIYKITQSFPDEEKFSLINQMRRSAVSISANIAESCGRFGTKDRIQFLMIARGSIFETRSHLSIAIGLSYIDKKLFDDLDTNYEIITRRLNAFNNHLRAQINQSTS
jgi:four helix bundle protein